MSMDLWVTLQRGRCRSGKADYFLPRPGASIESSHHFSLVTFLTFFKLSLDSADLKSSLLQCQWKQANYCSHHCVWTFWLVTWCRSKPSVALSASLSHYLDRAEKQLLLLRSFVRRREEVKGSVLTFDGDCAGSFTMPWKPNTVCDIYCLWWSIATVLHRMEMNMKGYQLDELVAILNTRGFFCCFFTYNKIFLSVELSV